MFSYSYEARQEYDESDEQSQHTEICATVAVTCVSGKCNRIYYCC